MEKRIVVELLSLVVDVAHHVLLLFVHRLGTSRSWVYVEQLDCRAHGINDLCIATSLPEDLILR